MLGMMILINGDRLLGEIYDGYSDDEVPSPSYQIEHPFKMEFRTIDGDYAFVLSPYVNFMNPEQTFLDIDKSKVISIVSINEELKKYYRNTKVYNGTFIKPVLERGLKTVNDSLEIAIQPDTERFARIMKEHGIHEFPSEAKH